MSESVVLVELDMPPAGTACVLCKGKGHFCQADEWTSGDSGEGICQPCIDGNTCPAMIARGVTPTRRDDPFVFPVIGKGEQEANRKSVIEEAKDLLRQGKNPHGVAERVGLSVSTVENIKRELQIAGPVRTKTKLPQAHSEPAPTIEANLDAGQKYAAEIGRAAQMEIGESVLFPAVKGMTLNEFSKDLLGELCDHPSTSDGYWKVHSDSAAGGSRLTRLPQEEENDVPAMCGCGRPATHRGRCSVRRGRVTVVPSVHRDMPIKAVKPELKVATPVTIVTVPRDEPTPDMTLSRAFEMVRAELSAANESLLDAGEGEDFTESIKANKDAIDLLHDYHPAFMGFNVGGQKVSVYERAKEQAQSELQLIDLEIQRLTTRRGALLPILESLTKGHKAERETR